MNIDSIKRLLQQEAENLYNQSSTPENFMSRIQPLMKAMEEEYHADILSENDLESILVAAKSKKNQQAVNNNKFFDVVDLCMYRAN